jgi:hypothetical protein
VDRWGIRNVMMAWTACFVVGLVCNFAAYAMVGPPAGLPGR